MQYSNIYRMADYGPNNRDMFFPDIHEVKVSVDDFMNCYIKIWVQITDILVVALSDREIIFLHIEMDEICTKWAVLIMRCNLHVPVPDSWLVLSLVVSCAKNS
jgi:hypothetical protein